MRPLAVLNAIVFGSAAAITFGLAGVSGASLLGMLKGRRWRWLAHAAMWLVVAGITALYWPR